MSPSNDFSKVLRYAIISLVERRCADTITANISNIPTSHLLYDNSICTGFIKVSSATGLLWTLY